MCNHITIFQYDKTQVGFLRPFKKNIYNSLYTGTIYENSSNYNWSKEEQNFIITSLFTGQEILKRSTTQNCIRSNVISFPTKDYGVGLFPLLHQNKPFANIRNIAHKNNFYVFALIKDIDKVTIAKTVFNPYSVAMKQLGINIPGTIYIDTTYLRSYLDQKDYQGYGGILIHEVLHLYNHEHPGNSIKTKYEPNYFINVVERCVNGSQINNNY